MNENKMTIRAKIGAHLTLHVKSLTFPEIQTRLACMRKNVTADWFLCIPHKHGVGTGISRDLVHNDHCNFEIYGEF